MKLSYLVFPFFVNSLLAAAGNDQHNDKNKKTKKLVH